MCREGQIFSQNIQIVNLKVNGENLIHFCFFHICADISFFYIVYISCISFKSTTKSKHNFDTVSI